MKKRFILLILLIFVVSCGRDELTLDNFIDKATFNGYIIKEDNEGYESYNKILKVYYAINREYAYDNQLLELKDTDYAHNFFLLNMNDIKENITTGDYEKKKTNSDYELYHAENFENYYLVIRDNKNIIYITAPIGYINEIEEFLKELDLEF